MWRKETPSARVSLPDDIVQPTVSVEHRGAVLLRGGLPFFVFPLRFAPWSIEKGGVGHTPRRLDARIMAMIKTPFFSFFFSSSFVVLAQTASRAGQCTALERNLPFFFVCSTSALVVVVVVRRNPLETDSRATFFYRKKKRTAILDCLALFFFANAPQNREWDDLGHSSHGPRTLISSLMSSESTLAGVTAAIHSHDTKAPRSS